MLGIFKIRIQLIGGEVILEECEIKPDQVNPINRTIVIALLKAKVIINEIKRGNDK